MSHQIRCSKHACTTWPHTKCCVACVLTLSSTYLLPHVLPILLLWMGLLFSHAAVCRRLSYNAFCSSIGDKYKSSVYPDKEYSKHTQHVQHTIYCFRYFLILPVDWENENKKGYWTSNSSRGRQHEKQAHYCTPFVSECRGHNPLCQSPQKKQNRLRTLRIWC